MEKSQSAFTKLAIFATVGLSALLTVPFIINQIRKSEKRKQKVELRKLKDNHQQKLNQAEQEAKLDLGTQDLRKTDNHYVPKFFNQVSKYEIHKIVLTGGPCAGKTTAMTYISSKLRERGIKVLVVPEFATLIANGGGLININKMTLQQIIKLQSVIMRGIIALEDSFCELAEITNTPTIILCDRGVMDGAAYMTPQGWQVLLDEHGYNLINLRDKRYDAVIHLVTAADGAEEFYNLDNNQARYESTKAEAISLDKRIREAWVGHPLFVIIDNHSSKNFDDKIRKVFEAVLVAVGLPEAPKFYRKYLLKADMDQRDGIPYIPEKYKTETLYMEDTILKSNDPKVERKIRKRGTKDSYLYIYSTMLYKKSRDEMTDQDFVDDGIERKRQITAREYLLLYEEKDPKRKTLVKCRQCFIYKEDYFFIDTFLNVPERFSLLNIEANKDLSSLNLPPFISIEKDITDVLAYTTYNVALIGQQETIKA